MIIAVWIAGACELRDEKQPQLVNRNKHFLVSRCCACYCPAMPNKFAIKQFKYNVDTTFKPFFIIASAGFRLQIRFRVDIWII